MGLLHDILSGRITEGGFGDLILTLAVLLYIAITFTFFLILPFYIYVNKVNREIDKKSVVYPITNHFYEMVKKFYGLLAFVAFVTFVTSIAYQKHEPSTFLHKNSSKLEPDKQFAYFFFAYELTAGLSFFCLSAMVQVFQILIFILSVLRFSLYFIPSLEAFVKESQQFLIEHIEYAYVFIVLKDISFLLWCLYSIVVNKVSRLEHPPVIYFSILNVLVLISSFLHIPIMFSVRQFAYLPSSQQNNPQRYILIQSMVFFIFKIIFTPFSILFYSVGSIYFFVIFSVVSDILVTPVVIQISYLLCNKRNIDILWKDFRIKQFLKVLFSCSSTATVRPVHTAGDLTNTRY